jgi:coenzyme PQQ synthesis protein D (PqqD)
MKPVARREGVLVRELAGEMLVYEQGPHRAHCLNRTAAAVFVNADGSRSVADLARLLAPEADPGESEAVVEKTLARLDEAGLLETAAPPGGWSRRECVRRVGLAAAVLLPIVASILVPAPAEAAATCVSNCSSKLDGTPCSCFGADPCTASCVGGFCSDGGGC